jgi:hypothetical protein
VRGNVAGWHADELSGAARGRPGARAQQGAQCIAMIATASVTAALPPRRRRASGKPAASAGAAGPDTLP